LVQTNKAICFPVQTTPDVNKEANKAGVTNKETLRRRQVLIAIRQYSIHPVLLLLLSAELVAHIAAVLLSIQYCHSSV